MKPNELPFVPFRGAEPAPGAFAFPPRVPASVAEPNKLIAGKGGGHRDDKAPEGTHAKVMLA